MTDLATRRFTAQRPSLVIYSRNWDTTLIVTLSGTWMLEGAEVGWIMTHVSVTQLVCGFFRSLVILSILMMAQVGRGTANFIILHFQDNVCSVCVDEHRVELVYCWWWWAAACRIVMLK